MKRLVLALTLVVIVGTTAMSPAKAWGTQSQQVYNWGDPWGDPSGLQYDGPTPVEGVPGTVVQISTSNSASYALTSNGEVWAWGVGQGGALGNGTMPTSTTTPVQVEFPPGIRIAALPSPMPFDTGMAIDTNGNIWGWGANVENSLCVRANNLLYPVQLPFTQVTQASGAGAHALYLSNGKLYACGGNAGGELGDGTTVASTNPVLVTGLPDQPIATIGSSWEDSGAVMADGSYYDWGYNAADQLGDGTTTNSDAPVRVDLPAKVSQLSLGGSAPDNGQTVAILTNGSVWTWGDDQYGQLGIGKVTSSSGPTQVDVPAGVSFVQVVSGGSTIYGVDSSGAVWAWGQNNVGQLGLGGTTVSDVPVKVGISLSCISSTAANVEGLSEVGASGVIQPVPCATTAAPVTTADSEAHGYWLVGSDGGIFAFGAAQFYGSTGSLVLQRPVVGIVPTADRGGYWLDASDGGVFSFGDTQFYGSIPGLGLHPAGSGLPDSLNAPIVGMVSSHDQGGYFMVASDGGIFAFGDAHFEGSCPGIGGCLGPAVAVMPDAGRNGYWVVTATGNVYSFGDAPYLGAPGSQASSITSAVPTPDGGGYYILDADGQVFAYGDAVYHGNTPPGATGGLDPATAVFVTSDNGGYWVADAVGKVFPFGDAPNDGDMSRTHLDGAIIAANGN
jgi:alpha-tubulin suppressor-like RCC1 family protein